MFILIITGRMKVIVMMMVDSGRGEMIDYDEKRELGIEVGTVRTVGMGPRCSRG